MNPFIHSLLKTSLFGSSGKRRVAPARKPLASKLRAPLRIENLEDRTVPALIGSQLQALLNGTLIPIPGSALGTLVAPTPAPAPTSAVQSASGSIAPAPAPAPVPTPLPVAVVAPTPAPAPAPAAA